ncbi:hypothetical protein CYY_010493, partial [Polysphondylium violaceum]
VSTVSIVVDDSGDVGVLDSLESVIPVAVNNGVGGFEDMVQEDVGVNLEISEDECESLRNHMFTKYEKLFVDEFPNFVPKDRGKFNMKIELKPDAKPFNISYGKKSQKILERDKATLKTLLKSGVVERAHSGDRCSPSFYVEVPGKEPRLVLDFSALNKDTVEFVHPMARIDEILESINGCKIITVIDLKSGFHHLRLDPESRKYTAFKMDGALYQWTRPCFGLRNAPAYFNNWLGSVLCDYDTFCKIFVDDILIFSNSLEEHQRHLDIIFSKLLDEEVYLSRPKAQLVRTKVVYAGHTVSHEGIKPLHSKVDAIKNIPYPTTVKEVRAFLGAINYYRKFVKDINSLTYELTELTKSKQKKITLTDTAKENIDTIKNILTSEPCLALPNYHLPFHVYVDASDVGTGLMITQKFDDGERPILYDSKKFDQAQRNYNTKDRELLAVVNALIKYDYMLKDKKFFLYTDHKNLLYLENSRDLSKRIDRWHEFIAPFIFDIIHIPGESNTIPDLLSRDMSFYNEWDTDFESLVRASYDTESTYLIKFLKAIRSRNDVVEHDGLLYINADKSGDAKRLVIVDPKQINQIIWEAHSTVYAGHPGRDRLHRKLSKHYFFPRFTETIKKFVINCVECQKSRIESNKHGYLQSLPIPPRPWLDLSMDFLSLPTSTDGMDNLFVVVDRFSKMVKLHPCKKTVTSKEIAKWFLDNVVCVFGIPDTIVSDQDTKFTSDLWSGIMKGLGTTLNLTQPHRAQADGQTERVNRVLVEMITKLATQRRKWSSDIAMIEMAINHNINTSTGLSPSAVCYGFEPRLPFNMKTNTLQDYSNNLLYYRDMVKDNMLEAQIQQSYYHNRNVSPTSFNIGDEILIKRYRLNTADKVIFKNDRKLFALFCGPFKIIEKKSDVNYVIDTKNIRNRKRT